MDTDASLQADPSGGASPWNDSPWGDSPAVVAETGDFAVVYKPPFMHSAPLGLRRAATLLEWYARIYPPVLALKGMKPAEGGLIHRLDYETEGLVLMGKNQNALDALLLGQRQGFMVKEYSALTRCRAGGSPPPGFPPPPFGELPRASFCIRSFFRPWGPGRKAVRPAEALLPGRKETAGDQGRPYATEVLAWEQGEGGVCFHLRLKRGFRHQIRCHLSWIGMPVRRDMLYGAPEEPAEPRRPFALRSRLIRFPDPRTGATREYSLPGYQ
ncbi:MAG: RNA pseudouridine synthase [Treponema sp.]|jgi:23S rRNA pseudouridine1911/1915/1917 synthase|nr:RNA pseudouridine synthase [Treponema sp.]